MTSLEETPKDEIAELKKALGRVLACKFRMAEKKSGWRFSFRADNGTIEKWEKLVNG